MSDDLTLGDILKERVRTRKEIIKKLRVYARRLRKDLGRVSFILFGSFARGDYNLWSDIDVIIISESFREVRFIERCLMIGDPFGNLSPICWTPEEFEEMIRKPSWRKALQHSVMILDMHGLERKLKSERVAILSE